MANRSYANLGMRPRGVIAVLTLVSHLLATLGFPLPAPVRNSKDASRPYPCQNRPCGYLSADECWKGDCCCFTLEEKLAWAEANGIEPPVHVRPLVESRKARRATPKKSCCSESSSGPEQSISSSSSCCGHGQPAGSPCCSQKPHEAEPKSECPDCNPKPGSQGCEKRSPPASGSGVRWIVGIFAQKCRGEGPARIFQLDPVTVSDLTPTLVVGPEPVDWVALRSDRLAPSSHRPPTPPPRCS